MADPNYSGSYEIRVYAGRPGGSSVKVARTYELAGDGWLSMSISVATGDSFFYVELFETGSDRMAWSAPIWGQRL